MFKVKGDFLDTAAAGILVGAAAVVAFSGKAFLKTRLGPIYLLELMIIAWGVCVLVSPHRKQTFAHAKNLVKPLRWALLFFAWGLILFLFDFFFRRDSIVSISWFLQHASLFIYPVVWMGAGAWLGKRSVSTVKTLVYLILFGNVIQSFFIGTPNLSLGPLAVVGLMFILGEKKPLKFKWPGLLLFGLASFYPIWMYWWLGSMQRVTLFLVLLGAISTAFFVHGKNFKRAIWDVGVVLAVLVSGIVVLSYSGPSMREQILKVMQHDDDYTYGKNLKRIPAPPFAFTDRKFWWAQSVKDWQTNPVFGVGFAVEVPSYVRANTKNDGRYIGAPDLWSQFLGTTISGPHNSYLTVLARMGLVGLGILILLLGDWALAARRFLTSKKPQLYELVIVFITLNGLLHAVVQIGLESPANCMLLWLAAGLVRGRTA